MRKKKPQTNKQKNKKREKKNRDAGLLPISSKFWVIGDEKKEAQAAIRGAAKAYTDRARDKLEDD